MKRTAPRRKSRTERHSSARAGTHKSHMRLAATWMLPTKMAAEHALDGVASLVKAAAEAAFPASVGLERDVENSTLPLDEVAEAVGVLGRSAWTMQRAGRSSSSASAARQSAAWPGVRRNASGLPWASAMAWIFVLRPPRLIPIAWRTPPFSAGNRTVGLHMRAVDQNLSGRLTGNGQCFEYRRPDTLF